MIAAVVFDMDGVLVDTEHVWSEVRGAVVARHGGTWTEQDQRNVMGDNSRQWSAYMRERWSLPLSDDAIFQEVLTTMIAAYERDLVVLPGARGTVAALGARYPLAVASSSPRDLILAALRIAGLLDAFTTIVSSDDVSHGKPAPDVYLLAASRLNVAPADCAAVEDSTNGIRAAVAAGMVTIAVPNAAYLPSGDALESAWAVLPDLHGLTVELVERLRPAS